MKKIILLVIFSFLSVSMVIFFSQLIPGTETLKSVSALHFLSSNASDYNIPNVVTSIVTQYRGYDTLGEITVLFLAIAGVYMLVSISGLKGIDSILEEPGAIVRTAAGVLFPVIMMFGAYIIINGHLSPGGGFQGGAVIGSGMLLMLLSGNKKEIAGTATHITESFAVLVILIIGLIGIYMFNGFLSNIIDNLGIFGTVLSGGIVPVIYALVGIKVTVEFFHLSEYLLRS